MRTHRRFRALAARLALAAALVAPVAPATADHTVPEGTTWTEVYFPSADGTELHADVFRPAGLPPTAKTPVILAIGPYFSSSGSTTPSNPTNDGPTVRFPELYEEGDIARRGYTYVQVDLRGFGGSAGCGDFGGPGEQADVKAAVEWAARQPWSNGRVGMWGKSYDAWTQVMALAVKPKGLAAAVIQAPLLEAYRGLFMNGVHYDAGWYGTPGLYAGIDLQPPSAESEPKEIQNWATGAATNPQCYVLNQANSPNADRGSAFWKARELVSRAARSTVPVLWSHGFLDANTKPDNFVDLWRTLRGHHRGWFGQWDHVRGSQDALVGREGFLNEALAMFDTYLKGRPARSTGLSRLPNVEVQDNAGTWRAESAWPPADARYYPLPIGTGSYDDGPLNSAGDPGDGLWAFTPEAPYHLRISGVPRITVDVTPTAGAANLVALVYDVSPEGDSVLITRGAHAVTKAGKITFDLYPQDWIVEEGNRIGVFVSGSDTSWFTPAQSGGRVAVTGGSLAVPFLTWERRSFLAGDEASAMSNWFEADIPAATVDANEKPTRFPPRMRRR